MSPNRGVGRRTPVNEENIRWNPDAGRAEARAMNRADVCARTMAFAVRAGKLADHLPRNAAGRTAGGQVVRCACSVAANYRSAQRARSRADFVSKITIVLEEADEAEFWLDFIVQAELMTAPRLAGLRKEADELVRIFAAMRRTARAGLR